MSGTAKKTKKQRKFGRNKPKCLRYRTAQRAEVNKLRRLLQHVRRAGVAEMTPQVVDCYKRLTTVLSLDKVRAVRTLLGMR